MDSFFAGLAQTIAEIHFQYTEQFLTALLPMAVTVILHGYGMKLVGLCFRRFGARRGPRAGPHIMVVVAIVAIMLATHYVEVSSWAVFYYLTDMLPNFKNAMNFSINAYTTLGASNITLHGRWQGLDGFEAMTAMLMFGWSTAVLAAVVQRMQSLDDRD